MCIFFFRLMKPNPVNINQDAFVWSVRNHDLMALLVFQGAVSNAMMQIYTRIIPCRRPGLMLCLRLGLLGSLWTRRVVGSNEATTEEVLGGVPNAELGRESGRTLHEEAEQNAPNKTKLVRHLND